MSDRQEAYDNFTAVVLCHSDIQFIIPSMASKKTMEVFMV